VPQIDRQPLAPLVVDPERLVEDLGNMRAMLDRAQPVVEDGGQNRIEGAEHDPDAINYAVIQNK
jgi:hypothetical protein